MRKHYGSLFSGFVAFLIAAPALAQMSSGNRPAYRSPMDVAYSPPSGSRLAVADRTWPGLVVINASDGSVVQQVKLAGDPYHVVWNGDGSKVYVAEGTNGTVAEIEVPSGTLPARRFVIGLVAKGLAITPDGARLLVCDRASNKLVVVKLASGEIEKKIDMVREPGTVAVDKDGKYAIVGNKLSKPADPLHGNPDPAAEMSIVDLSTWQVTGVTLTRQADMVRHVVLSPDGKWAYVTHQSPRGGLPVTSLENGWIMTNALSIIDMTARTLYASFIFDKSGSGGAHPWGAAINKGGTKLWVALEGVREVATVDLTALHKKLAALTTLKDRTDLANDLSVLHSAGIIKRTQYPDIDGPRGLALSPDDATLAVAAYFSSKVLFVSADKMTVSKTVTLPDNPPDDDIRKGERYYYSAMNCQQTWLSCSSCHDEGRPDGLNWDLQNDGTGNPKQTKAHIYSSETPPTNVSGCRENAEVSSRMGYTFIEFQAAPEERVQATYQFMKSLAPEPSPFLGADGQLTAEAVKGKELFDGTMGCKDCHAGQYFTDMKKHDVGTRRFGDDGPDNNPQWDVNGWDTPTLIEVWRTAPYLHLGSAMTIKDAILAHNKDKSITDAQAVQLEAYVKQIGPTRKTNLPNNPDGGSITPSTGGSSGSSDSSGSEATAGSTGTSDSAGASGTTPDSSSTGGTTGAAGAPGGDSSASSSSSDSGKSSCICNLSAHPSSRGRLLALLPLALFALRASRRRR